MDGSLIPTSFNSILSSFGKVNRAEKSDLQKSDVHVEKRTATQCSDPNVRTQHFPNTQLLTHCDSPAV